MISCAESVYNSVIHIEGDTAACPATSADCMVRIIGSCFVQVVGTSNGLLPKSKYV